MQDGLALALYTCTGDASLQASVNCQFLLWNSLAAMYIIIVYRYMHLYMIMELYMNEGKHRSIVVLLYCGEMNLLLKVRGSRLSWQKLPTVYTSPYFIFPPIPSFITSTIPCALHLPLRIKNMSQVELSSLLVTRTYRYVQTAPRNCLYTCYSGECIRVQTTS